MSTCMTMKIEEDTVLNQKQGIVTILNCNSDTNFTPNSPPSLRRTLSADMSSKKWLPPKGSSNLIKKISSSENLFQLHPNNSFSSSEEDGEFKETKMDDESEAERERLEIWSSIQKNKKEEQQKGGSFDTWGSLMCLKTNDEISKSLPPYIHPLAKRTKSSLSRKSLEICTESLGSETGSDGPVSSYPPSESLGSDTGSDGLLSSDPPSETEDTEEHQQNHQEQEPEEDKKEVEDKQEEVLEVARFNYGGVAATTKKSPPRSFPPPLPSLSRQDGPSFQMRPHRDNGRLVLEAVSLPSLNNFCVQRQDGRLVLTFANQDQEIGENDEKENDGVGELEEEFEGFEEEKDDPYEYEDEIEDEEVEDADGDGGSKSVIEKGSFMSFDKTTIKSSIHWIGSNNKMVNKPIGVVNMNPKWSKKFNNEVDNKNFEDKDVQVVEASQMVKSLPPRPRVARLIPSAPNAATGSFNLNAYEHYWRTTKPTTTATKGGNYPLGPYQENNNNNNNKNKIVVSAAAQKYHHLHSNFPFLFLFKTSATQIHLQDLDPNPSMATPDHLFNLRNNFYLGAYQAAINSSEVSNLSPDDIIERDTLVYRCYISLGQLQFVISEINDSAPTPLQAVKLLALYFSSPDSKESAIASIKEWLADPAIGNNATLRLVAGIIFLHEQDFNEALKYTNAGGTMELTALNVQIFIKMHRSDYAERQLRIMQQIDEDHTLTQLANAWLDLAVGGAKIQEAHLIFQDLSERYQSTSLLLNGKAVCCMQMGNFDEAETLLVEALNKDARDPETLANLVVCCLHLGKPSSKSFSQLKLSHPDHVLVKRVSAAEESFDRALQSAS